MTSPETETDDLPDAAVTDQLDGEAAADDAQSEEQPKLTLEVTVARPSACQRHVTVTIPHEDIERYFNKQFDELMPKAAVPGFRPGHAPRKLVERRFREQLSDQVKGSLLMDSMTQVSEEQKFSAISEPDFDFDAVKVPNEGPMTFEFNLEVRPEFDLPQWKGMNIKKPIRQFSDDDIDRHLKNVLSRYGQLVPHDGPAEADDYVTLNITFRHNGAVLSRVEEESACLKPKLSFADGTLAGFDKLVAGAQADTKLQTKVTISNEAANEQLRGQEVDVELEILDVKKLELPEMNREFLSRIGDFESEEKLRETVKSEMQRQLAYHQQQGVRQQITSLLTSAADWELPPDLLKRQARRELERAIMELQSSGFSNEQIRAHENELRQNSQASTATALKEHFILERIAEDEKIEDQPEDYDREIALIAQQQQESPRRVRARLEKRGLMDTLRNQIIERKVVELITSHAQFKEVDFQFEAGDTEAVDHAIAGEPGDSEIPAAKPGGDAETLPFPADHK